MSLSFPSLSLRSAALFLFAALAAGSVPLAAQTLEDGLDNPPPLQSVTTEAALLDETNLPSGEWVYTTGTTHDGVDAVTSTLPNRSTSELNATVQGPAVVSFWWKMNGKRTFDSLQFASGNDSGSITPEQNDTIDWQQVSVEVDMGVQPLIWVHRRLTSLAGPSQQAWIDELVVTPIPNNPALQAALENPGTPPYTIHSTDWTSAPLAGAQNGTAAKSGAVVPGAVSRMQLQIEGPATIEFDWGMASEDGDGSALEFIVNNEFPPVASLTNSQTLTNASVDLGPGTHTLKWEFSRGFEGTDEYAGETEGYVDALVITPFSASPSLADAVDRPGGVYSNSWTLQMQVVRDGSDAAMVTAPELSKARRLYVELPDEAGLLTYWYKTDADPLSGYLRTLVDGDQIREVNGQNDWTKVEVNLPQGSDRVFQAFFFRISNPNGSSANTRAYIDEITFTPGATNYQPDLSIGPLKKGLKGVGTVNASGAGQISTIRAPLTRPVGEWAIRIQNNSVSDTDKVFLRGVGSRRDFQIFYVVEDGGEPLNFSAAFAAGIFETNQLSPNASEAHEIWVAPKRNKLKKRSHLLRVIGTSEADPGKIDVVRTKLLVKKR
jgi:hypothetical protein